MKFSRMVLRMSLAAGILPQLALSTYAADDSGARTFKFDFQENHPVVYSVKSTVNNITDQTIQLDTGNKSALNKSTVETRYKIRLTPIRKAKDGIWTLHYEPFDIEQDVDTTGKSGHVVTTIRGLEIKSTQNGITVMDTSKDVGMSQAKNIKQMVYPMLLSGNIDLKPDGEASKFTGDLPFVDYWTELNRYRIGFFDIKFPTSAVAPGGSWNGTLTLNDMQGLKLGDKGIIETNVFSRGLSPSSGAEPIETFESTMASNSKDVMGSMETMGQNAMINIPSMVSNRSGKYQFDPAAGSLLSGSEDESVKITMDMLVQGHTVTTTLEIQTTSKFERLKN